MRTESCEACASVQPQSFRGTFRRRESVPEAALTGRASASSLRWGIRGTLRAHGRGPRRTAPGSRSPARRRPRRQPALLRGQRSRRSESQVRAGDRAGLGRRVVVREQRRTSRRRVFTSRSRPRTGHCAALLRRRARRRRARQRRPAVERTYHPGYYAAFVLDPDGNNVEAVYHGPFERSAPSVVFTWDEPE